MNERLRRTLLLAVFVLGIASTLGTGSGGSFAPGGPVPGGALDGIWTGTLHSNTTGLSEAVTALAQNGQLFLIDVPATRVSSGSTVVQQSSFTADLGLYQMQGPRLSSLSLTGTFVQGATVTADFTAGLSDQGTLNLQFNRLYNRASSLNLTQGVWTQATGVYTNTISVNADGSFFGSDSAGCTYTGALSISDPSFGLYRVTVKAELCGALNGSYSGLAYLSDAQGTNDTLNLAATNTANGLYFSFARQ